MHTPPFPHIGKITPFPRNAGGSFWIIRNVRRLPKENYDAIDAFTGGVTPNTKGEPKMDEIHRVFAWMREEDVPVTQYLAVPLKKTQVKKEQAT